MLAALYHCWGWWSWGYGWSKSISKLFAGHIFAHSKSFSEERENSMVPTYSTAGKMLASIVQRHRTTRYWCLVRKAEENSHIVKSRSMSVQWHPQFWSSGFSAVGLYAHHEVPSWMALRATCHWKVMRGREYRMADKSTSKDWFVKRDRSRILFLCFLLCGFLP